MDSTAFSEQKRRILAHRPSSLNDRVTVTDTFSISACRQDETKLISAITNMIAVYSSDDFDTIEKELSSPSLSLSGSKVRLDDTTASRLWRSGYGHRLVDSGCFKWRLEIIDRNGAFHLGITSEWNVFDEEVSSQFPFARLEDGLPRGCVMFSTGLCETSHMGFAVGDGFKYFNKRMNRDTVQKNGVTLGENVLSSCDSAARRVVQGDIIEIDLNMDERTVTFSQNGSLLFRVINLKNVGFRLGVSIMRKDMGNPSIRVL